MGSLKLSLAAMVSCVVIAASQPYQTARADDLVASVLPLSRSPVVGETASAFATVINASGQNLTGCTVSLPNFDGTFGFQTTNPATNAPTGTENQPFNLAATGAGTVQTLVVFLQPSAVLAPTNELLVFGCANSTAAASIIGVDTLLLTASTTPTPDIVALAATPSTDGVVRMPGVGSAQAFAVATVNVGSAAPITVSADTGDISLPLQVQICQTDPSNGQCFATPSSTVTTTIAQSGTPTFSIFTTATAAIPYFPADVRLFLRFKDGNGVTRGSTSVALTTASTLASGQTAGGLYAGVYRVTSGPFLGLAGEAIVLVAENGQMEGVTIDPTTSATISSLFTAQAIPASSLQYDAQGTVFAAGGYTLPNGETVSPLAISGAVSPRNFLAGLYGLDDETGEFYVSYVASIYEQPSSLSLLAGNWYIRDLEGDVAGTLQINANGSFDGSDANNCNYSGTISIINSSYNAYNINLSVSSCGQINGPYQGLGFLYEIQNPNDAFQFELSSSTAIETNYITRE